MKKRSCILIIGCLFSLTVFSKQNERTQTEVTITNKIIWKKPVIQHLTGADKFPFLSFYNAQYDISKHPFPIYSERFRLPQGVFGAEATLGSETYIPLSDSEIAIINKYDDKKNSIITTDIKPVITVVMQKKTAYAFVHFIPIKKNNLTGIYEKLISFSLHVTPSQAIMPIKRPVFSVQAANSVLATGEWYKIAVTTDGIYKMSYSFLKSLGMDVAGINPKNIRVYGNGGGQLPFANASFRYDDLQENAISVIGENDGKFDSTDYVLFYGQSQHRWKYNKQDKRFHHALNIYSDTTYYFVTSELGAGKRVSIQNSSSTAPTNIVTSFDDPKFHESEAVNLLKSGRQWLGETFDIITNYSFSFDFPNIETTSPVHAYMEVAARADNPGTNFYWRVSGASSSVNVTSVNTSDIYGPYYNMASDTMSFIPSAGTIQVSISKTTPTPSIGWLNYIEVNARRQLIMNGDQMNFRDILSVNPGNISKFIVANVTSAIKVWDVTDPINVKLQQGDLSGTSFSFTLITDTLKQFCAFNGQSFFTPQAEGEVQNQNLHAMPESNLIIVANPLFLDEANKLADLHRTKDNLSVSVATTDQVFNEFSSGAQDVSAIRDFVRMFYTRATDSTQLPQYLLLIGRGSYNVKARINNTNYVPAYESAVSNDPINSYPSDDFYGMLDTNEGTWDTNPNMLDIGVGRLPVTSVNELSAILSKINKYISVPGTIETGNSCATDVCYGFGDWVNYLTFIADDEDNGDHLKQAEWLTQKVNTNNKEYNLDKIYFDSYQQIATPGGDRYPDASAAFEKRMAKGALIVNYTGHGGPVGLAHERFLEIHSINAWKNQCKLPFFFTATCDFSAWDNPSQISAGELTLLNPDGGSIGLMSTTRVVYSGPNFTLNSYFYDHVFSFLPNGQRPRLGDLYMETKNDIPPYQINQRNFSLLGDPALTLHYPDYSVTTDAINGIPVGSSQKDTIRALSRVTVQGKVQDRSGNLLTNFNGIIYPAVYDKASKISTLGNDASSPIITFQLQKNIIFKGKASVTNGVFSFSFIVPKDIAYDFGPGRISYYAHNGLEDANGYFEDFIIGGTDTAAKKDVTGPDIKIYLNDDKFVAGGITNDDPKIYAVLSDSNGINTAGSSIGHDITAILDGNTAKPIVLNDYYESDLNKYKSGTVRYPLTGLSEGNHTLTVKVWDVYNNSSSATTEFVVASSAKLALKHVLNYPNPFTTKTSFYFENNKCCTTMDVQIQIFTISGKLLKTIHEKENMEGFRSEPINWDGRDDYGDHIARGVYIYRLRVRTSSGESSEKFEKLVILK